jgi:DNA-binding GntR family transcriptional regulator
MLEFAAVKKIRIPENLTSRAYRAIKDYILDGRFDENTRLTEEFLSQQLGISKSPVREALTRLESERLIQIEPRRGAHLREFSINEIAELYDLREVLEVYAVGRAKLTPALLAALRGCVERSQKHLQVNDKRRYIEEDVNFHALLAAASGNELLTEILRNIQHQVWLFRRKTYDLSRSKATETHAAIVQALEKSDKEEAQRLMREHVTEVRDKLIRYLEQQNGQR